MEDISCFQCPSVEKMETHFVFFNVHLSVKSFLTGSINNTLLRFIRYFYGLLRWNSRDWISHDWPESDSGRSIAWSYLAVDHRQPRVLQAFVSVWISLWSLTELSDHRARPGFTATLATRPMTELTTDRSACHDCLRTNYSSSKQ